MSIHIIFENDNAADNREYFIRGYRDDIIVEIKEKRYRIYATNISGLQKDFELDKKCYGYYCSEPNTILVEEATKEEIVHTIYYLHERNYFERLERRGFDDTNQ